MRGRGAYRCLHDDICLGRGDALSTEVVDAVCGPVERSEREATLKRYDFVSGGREHRNASTDLFFDWGDESSAEDVRASRGLVARSGHRDATLEGESLFRGIGEHRSARDAMRHEGSDWEGPEGLDTDHDFVGSQGEHVWRHLEQFG